MRFNLFVLLNKLFVKIYNVIMSAVNDINYKDNHVKTTSELEVSLSAAENIAHTVALEVLNSPLVTPLSMSSQSSTEHDALNDDPLELPDQQSKDPDPKQRFCVIGTREQRAGVPSFDINGKMFPAQIKT